MDKSKSIKLLEENKNVKNNAYGVKKWPLVIACVVVNFIAEVTLICVAFFLDWIRTVYNAR